MFQKPLRFLAAAALPATLVLSAPASASPGGGAQDTVVTALGLGSTDWTYHQVSSGTGATDSYQRNFDDSAWPTGQEGFGTTNGTCAWNNPADVKTPWAVNTDLLVRHWVHLPRDAQQVRIQGTVDNDAHVYLNGHLLQNVRSGNCKAGAIDVVVPASVLECCNVLAIRAQDHGLATYLNVKVTYVKPGTTAKNPPASA